MRIGQRLEQIHLHPDFALVGVITRALSPAETVVAGGAVRDALLGRAPKDLDLATAATPTEVQSAISALGLRTVDVGAAFGTINVVHERATVEVTTFRREDRYLDQRRPSAVSFTDAREDAARRDFTVNALFYDPARAEVIDFVGGLADLRAKRLTTVGDPRDRFAEDCLRMLRAVRFVAQLDFDLDGAAAVAIRDLRGDLARVSGERILAEMKRLLEGPARARALALAGDLGVLDEIWPGFTPAPDGSFAHWADAFANFTPDEARADAVLDRWRASREDRRRVIDQLRGVRALGSDATTLGARVRILGSAHGRGVAELARLRGIDVGAPAERLRVLGGTLPPPLLTGADLIARGARPDRALGRALDSLYEAQLAGEFSAPDEAWAWLAARPTDQS